MAILVLGATVLGRDAAVASPDPLPSWRDTAAKKAIVSFVENVTKTGGVDFVPPEERIAAFDNDGTLSTEKPLPVEAAFCFDRIKALAPQHPEWRTQQPFASVLAGDLKGVLATGQRGIMELATATHAGMTTTEFTTTVRQWLATARDERTGRPYTSLVYQPMIELLAYLRKNGFKTFIVSGGGTEFMRAGVGGVLGVPPEQVVGSVGKLELVERGGKLALLKQPAIELVDIGKGKPLSIESRIGRRPIAAFGNSNGDLEMLEWTTEGAGARFALLVHHDDAEREYAYDRADEQRTFDRVWDVAKKQKWTVVSMKGDWRTIYPPRTAAALDAPRAPAPVSGATALAR